MPKRPIRFDLFDINNVGEWGEYSREAWCMAR